MATPPPDAAAAAPTLDTVVPTGRIEGLTAWRAILMLAGLPLHAVWGDEAYPAFAAIALASGSFRMGAFFMISGLLAGFALTRRPATLVWMRERITCLGPPTLFAMLTICPFIGIVTGHGVWPFNPYHIWFLLALLAYTLLAALVHRIDGAWTIFDKVERRSREARRLQVAILLLTGLVSFVLMAVGRAIHAGAPAALVPTLGHLPMAMGCAPIYLLGFAAARAATLRRMLTASQRVPLAILGTAVVAHLALRSPWLPPLEPAAWAWWSDLLAVAGAAWCPAAATVVILCSATTIRQVPPVLARLADASFTIYILHYPIIVATKLALRPLALPVWTGFAVAILVGGGLSYAAYRRVVRHSPVLCTLFAGRPTAWRPHVATRYWPRKARSVSPI